MQRLSSWFAPKGGETTTFLTADEELPALQEAQRLSLNIISDASIKDVDEAEEELGKNSSPFHQLGRATALFLKAVLSVEKETIEQATLRLAEAEESAAEHQRRAQRDPSTANQSAIYPPGAEYALCHAECQVMSAILPILAENFMEGFKSIQKLRKAFNTLHGISQAEAKYVQQHHTPIGAPASPDKTIEDVDLRSLTTNEIDLYIHTGAAVTYGTLQLVLSMIPPTVSRLLSFFSFRGDRDEGFRKLWAASNFRGDVHGAIAGLMVLTFNNAVVVPCDIRPKSSIPRARLDQLLADMRAQHPRSKLWLIEQARMRERDHDLEGALQILDADGSSSLKQLESLRLFAKGLYSLFIHRYEDCAEAFLKCVERSTWSHSIYYYFAGVCHAELYREHRDKNPQQAEQYAQKAEQFLLKVLEPSSQKKRRFMSRPMPFDVFVQRKVTKWENRARLRGCKLIDAIGVSPTEELAFFWGGFRCMPPTQLEVSLDRLAWSEQQLGWDEEPADERAMLALLRASCLRFLGRLDDAQAQLTDGVRKYDLATIKACDRADAWVLPVSHYETAACFWLEAGGEDGDKAKLRACSEAIARVEKWESYEMETRIGIKVRTARQTLTKCGVIEG